MLLWSEKVCTKCGNLHKEKTKYCIKCKERSRQARRDWLSKPGVKERANALTREHRKTDRYKAVQKAYRDRNKDKVKQWKIVERAKMKQEREEFGLSWRQQAKWMRWLFAAGVEWT